MISKGFRFTPWLVVFFVALVAIPCLIYLELYLIAKIVGITITVTLVVVLRVWLHQLKKQGPSERYALTANDVYELRHLIPAFKELSVEDQKALQHRIGLFMGVLLIQNPNDLPVQLSSKNLAICGALFAFMQLDSTKEIVWIIQERARRLDGRYMYLGMEEVEDFRLNLEAEAIQSRLSV